MLVCNAIVVPVMLYTCNSWAEPTAVTTRIDDAFDHVHVQRYSFITGLAVCGCWVKPTQEPELAPVSVDVLLSDLTDGRQAAVGQIPCETEA